MPGMEFSFNFKTSATVNLIWPAIFRLYLDDTAVPCEATDFDFVFSANPMAMTRIPLAALQKLANVIAAILIAPFSASAITPPAGGVIAAWPWPFPNVQQEVVPPPAGGNLGDLQLDILSHKRILYLFLELNSILLELVDGSGGQPLLSGPLGITSTVNLATITDTPPGSSTSQGVILRAFVAQFFPKLDFIP